METEIKVIEKKSELNSPILVEGLPGIGNVGRVSVGYLISELKCEKIAELRSPHFLPLVVLDDKSVTHELKNEFCYSKHDEHDLIFVTGDTQSMKAEGHYHVSKKIMDFAEKLGVKKIITIGGYATGKEPGDGKVIGAVTDEKMLKEYAESEIDFDNDHPIGTIVGATGLLMGMAKSKGIQGLCLMGETMGFPLITDPKAADNVLKILKTILDLDIGLEKLEETVKEMKEQIKKTEKIHKQMMQQKKSEQQLKYIG